jgi:hypothetical protein
MRTVFTLSLLAVVVASAASAAKFAPISEPKAEPARSALPVIAPSPTAQASTSVRKPTVEVRQAPVPLQWGYKHETVAVATAESPTIADLTSKVMADQASTGQALLDQPGNPADGAAAKAAIEADGYKGVRGLVREADGSWRGKALRGRTEIAIRVGPDGSVSAD